MNWKFCALSSLVAGIVLLVGLLAVVLGVPTFDTGSASSDGSIGCSVKSSPAAGEVEVFRMSSTANAHAGTPGGSAYGERAYCGGVQGLGIDCGATRSAAVLSLSATDNAHVESAGIYATDVCLSGGDDATVDVTYGSTGGVGYACLATISGSTNAHVADCDGVGDYPTKVWVLVTPDNCPDTLNPGQENADGDSWGDACDECPTTATAWLVPVGDVDCDGWTSANETTITTDPNVACGFTAGAPTQSETWPADLVETNHINISDVLALKPHFGQTVPPAPARYDLVPDGAINISDVLAMKPFFGQNCTP